MEAGFRMGKYHIGQRMRIRGRKAGESQGRKSAVILLAFLLFLTGVFAAWMSAGMLPEEVSAAAPTTTVSKKTLYVGYSNYTIKFKNLSEKATVSYKSSNAKVAKVTSAGVIKPVKKGTATVTVTIRQNKKTYTRKIAVTVKNPYLSIPNKQKTLVQSSDYKLSGKAYGLKKPVFAFSSSDIRVAKVDRETGMVHARGAGIAEITMKDTVSGKSVSFTLTVIEQTEENAGQVYISTEEFGKDYVYTAPEDLSKLTEEEAAQAGYLADIQKRITEGNSITIQEMTDYFLNKSMEKSMEVAK